MDAARGRWEMGLPEKVAAIEKIGSFWYHLIVYSKPMPNNSREALIYFRKMLRSHEADNKSVTRALAFCFLTGHGTDQSVERAVALLRTLKEDYYHGEDYLPLRLDKIQENLSLVDAIRGNFKMMDTLPLPMSGGWGYTEQSAITVDLSLDDGYEEGRFFNLAQLEKLVFENRIFLECVMRSTERLSGIEWRVTDHETVTSRDKVFDRFTLHVHGCPEWVWNAVEHDWKMTKQRTPRSKAEAHSFIREWFLRSYKTEYWFDVTKVPEEFRVRMARDEIPNAKRKK